MAYGIYNYSYWVESKPTYILGGLTLYDSFCFIHLYTDEIPGRDRRGQYKLFEYYGDPEAPGRAWGGFAPVLRHLGARSLDLWIYNMFFGLLKKGYVRGIYPPTMVLYIIYGYIWHNARISRKDESFPFSFN